MAKKQFIRRHLLIINRLKSRSSSFEDLQEYLLIQGDILSEDLHISKRTFHRDLNEIKELYEIKIKHNKKENQYEIAESELENPFERVIEAMETINAIGLSNSMSNRLLLEKRKTNGSQHLHGLLHSIDNNLVVKFEHYSYWNDETTQRTVEAIAIKESQNRWYLVCYDCGKGEIRNFGLDRISNLEITSDKFISKKINITNYYQHAIGIETYEPATKVVLRFSDNQTNYLKSLPIHHSQKIISEDSGYIIIELFVHPTFDFILEILKYGEYVEVLEPQNLRETLKKRLTIATNLYK